MGKCIVSGCPNRMVAPNRLALNRPTRRFFRFPRDPDRVKVWLAALRETDKDRLEEHIICEDHFLPEDLCKAGIRGDAIPIMPPYLDGPLGLVGSWSRDALQEEAQWSPGPDPPKQDSGGGAEKPAEPETTRDSPEAAVRVVIADTPLSLLTRGFLELLMASGEGVVDIEEAAKNLQTLTCRVLNIIGVLRGLGLVQREPGNRVKWIGGPIYNFLFRNPLRFLVVLEKLQQVENELDQLIKMCSEQLFSLTEDPQNAASAYVSCEDIVRLFQDQTTIVVKAPLDTKLNVPPPDQKSARVHLIAEQNPILALTCEADPADPAASLPAGHSRPFTLLERSSVRIFSLHRVGDLRRPETKKRPL
ncbi:transcription factor E2F3 [Austrofundulus limnaeus]|uniref:Transcription factor E2F3 n=1 Tax=Austrofundulus limnaeus TaxID=52670 RepID=A0A2I4CPK5_AUSLI|nr:PREDICTED: transcription factor E2F3-like [Austrofundulus limnaeus]